MKTVPYADPRAPFHRKQAFDFGDGGLGNCVNNLTLGCDCLGVIKVRDMVSMGLFAIDPLLCLTFHASTLTVSSQIPTAPRKSPKM